MKSLILLYFLLFFSCTVPQNLKIEDNSTAAYLQLDFNSNKSSSVGVPIEDEREYIAVCFEKGESFVFQAESGLIIIEKVEDFFVFEFKGKGKSIRGKLSILPVEFKGYEEKISIDTYVSEEIKTYTFYRLVKTGDWVYEVSGKEDVFNYKVDYSNAEIKDVCDVVNK